MADSVYEYEETETPYEPPGVRVDLLDRLKWCLTSPVDSIEVVNFDENDNAYWSKLFLSGRSTHPVAKDFATEEPVKEMVIHFSDLQEQWDLFDEDDNDNQDLQVTIKATSGAGVTIEDFVRTCHAYFQSIQGQYNPDRKRYGKVPSPYVYDDCVDTTAAGPGNDYEIFIIREHVETLGEQWQRKIKLARKWRQGEAASSNNEVGGEESNSVRMVASQG
jgi:hypothetical protein